jgi:hypothetical protein
MNDLKFKTLEQVRIALDAVEDQRADLTLTQDEKSMLEQASVSLRNIERSIIREKEQDMVGLLQTDAKSLEDLADKIKKSSEKFEVLATTLGKACQVVEGLIKIITTAIGVGLI